MKKKGIILMLILTLILSSCSLGKKDSNPSAGNNNPLNQSDAAQDKGDGQENKDQQRINKEAIKIAAPDFELETLKGNKVKLSDLKGKTVVVNFFATWCPPCKAELPGFVSTMEKYEKSGSEVVFLFVDVDEDNETVKKFLDSRDYTFDTLMDKGAEVYSKYTLRGGIPTTTIVDKEGNIAAQHEGFMESSDLKAYIEKVLKK